MAKPFFTIDNKAAVPQIYVEGIIGHDADFTGFRNALSGIIDKGHKRCKMVINSGGGSMVEGFAIYDMLKNSGVVIEVEIIGMAASMAGVISQAASPGLLCIHSNASFMTHRPNTGVDGESDLLRSMADFADKLEIKAKAIFRNRTGLKDDDMADWFKPGSMKWFTAEEAVANGIADYIKVAPAATQTKPKEGFTNIADAYKFYNCTPASDAPTPAHSTQTKDKMKKTILVLNAYKVQHTLTDESTDEQVSAVVENALKAKDARIKELEDAAAANMKNEATVIATRMIEAGKAKAEMKDDLIAMGVANLELLKNMENGIQGRVDVKNAIVSTPVAGDDKNKATTKKFSQHTSAELRALKTSDMAAYKALFKAEYGVDYSE